MTENIPPPNSDQKQQRAPAPAQPSANSLSPDQSAVLPSPSLPPKTLNAEAAGIKGVLSSPMDRRTFIKWSAIGWAAFAAAVAGYATMFMRFMFPNVLFEPEQTFKAGYPDEYQTGEVSEKWKEKYATWIVRDEEKIYALSTTCTHLGCTPNWLANEGKFKCPCHGSGFYKSGINFEGPAPRPLERYRITLAEDGQILIDKTKRYQQEKGEWKDPESYLVV